MITKRAPDKSKTFMIALFSLWMVIHPAYLFFSILDESDLSAPYPCFKNMDQEDFIPAFKKKERPFEFVSLIRHVLVPHWSIGLILTPQYILPLLHSPIAVLRC